MNGLLNSPNKRKTGLLALAVLLLLLGAVDLVRGQNNVAIRSVAMLACMVSVICVRYARSSSATIETPPTWSERAARPGRPLWIVSLVLVPVAAISLACLYEDAVHGHQQLWPVYFFAGVTMACALCWSALVARLFVPK